MKEPTSLRANLGINNLLDLSLLAVTLYTIIICLALSIRTVRSRSRGRLGLRKLVLLANKSREISCCFLRLLDSGSCFGWRFAESSSEDATSVVYSCETGWSVQSLLDVNCWSLQLRKLRFVS